MSHACHTQIPANKNGVLWSSSSTTKEAHQNFRNKQSSHTSKFIISFFRVQALAKGMRVANEKMFRGSILKALPQGLFSWPVAEAATRGESSCPMDLTEQEIGERKKRNREDGSSTPTLVSKASLSFEESDSDSESARPAKRFRGQSKIVSVPQPTTRSETKATTTPKTSPKKAQEKSEFLSSVPEDVVAHCLSFLGSSEDRNALQNTCKVFRDISNKDEMLEKVDLGGDKETGKGGIIHDEDTPATAAAKLAPFARAGNAEALYMLGIIKCYCYQDLKNGVIMLKMASNRGYLRASYTLGLVLRDGLPEEAAKYMKMAADEGYIPALQELLPAREVKERYGEPSAEELRNYLDPVGLNRLLLRDYVDSAELRGLNTSHCWNPHCGKWAYKATNSGAHVPIRRPRTDENPPDLGIATAAGLVDDDGSVSSSSSNSNNNSPPNPTQQTNINHHDLRARLNGRAPSSSLARAAACSLKHPTPGTCTHAWEQNGVKVDRVSRMKMCSRCCRAKYCSKLCQVFDWRSSQHKMECQFL